MQAASQSAPEVGLAFASTPAAGGAPLVRHGAAVDAASVAELHQRQAGLSEIVSSLAPYQSLARGVRVRASRRAV